MDLEKTCQQCSYYNIVESTGNTEQCERCPLYRDEQPKRKLPKLDISIKKQENRYKLYQFFLRLHKAVKNKRQLEVARIILCYGNMPSRFISMRTGIPERSVRQYRVNLQYDLPEIFDNPQI